MYKQIDEKINIDINICIALLLQMGIKYNCNSIMK